MHKFALALACLAVTTTAHANTAKWRTIKNDLNLDLTVREVKTPRAALEQIDRMEFDKKRDVGDTLVIIEQIINLGEKLWNIIESNQAVSEVEHKYANALPAGVRGPEELDEFSPMQHKSYRMSGKNWYGMTVYDVTYTLVHRHGGRYEGKGQYLDGVTVLPNHVTTAWGYKLNMAVEGVSTVNVGTREKPIGSIMMQMTVKIGSVMKKSEFRSLYEFRGDSRSVTSLQN